MSHLGDKADFIHAPKGQAQQGLLDGRNERCCSQLRVCSTEQASVTLLMPRRNHCSPERGNGAERNRTAVRNTGVDHLVRELDPSF